MDDAEGAFAFRSAVYTHQGDAFNDGEALAVGGGFVSETLAGVGHFEHSSGVHSHVTESSVKVRVSRWTTAE